MEITKFHLETPLGMVCISGSGKVVERCQFLEGTASELASETKLQVPAEQLNEYFGKARKTFDCDLRANGTSFQKKVWKILQTIPYGKTTTYLALAKKIGNPKAVRAVANAIGKNPLLIFIPCHRVVGSNQSLTGYAGGLKRKEWLLQHENALQQNKLLF